jgi:glutamyl-tRNA reductase
MNFQLIGVNHHSAPVGLRERLAISESRLPEALQQLVQQPGVAGGLILSTCNRVEVMADTKSESVDLRSFLHDYFGLSPAAMESHIYEYQNRDAIRHLFRVTASLDSMVLGEPQILGQVKEAYATARAAGTISPHLDRILTHAFVVAKRVRTETSVGSCAVSIASVAVELAQSIFGSFDNKQVYLVGAGEMNELAARHLLARGARSILVSSFKYDRARNLATAIGGEAIRFQELYDNCDRADIVITSTAAQLPIFRREHGELFLQRRQNRPMFFIDISVPRNVDPEMKKLNGICVHDIDDLQQTVAQHVANRRKEAARAETIVDAEVERFQAGLQALDVTPTIIRLQEQMENIRKTEIDQARGCLGQLSPEQESAIDALTHKIVNKLIHNPITALKTAAREADVGTLLPAVERLFNLRDRKEVQSDLGSWRMQSHFRAPGKQSGRKRAMVGAPRSKA